MARKRGRPPIENPRTDKLEIRLTPEEKATIKRAAEKLDFEGGITEFVRDRNAAQCENHRLITGWRKEFIGEKLQKLLTGKHAIWLNPSTGLPQITSDLRVNE